MTLNSITIPMVLVIRKGSETRRVAFQHDCKPGTDLRALLADYGEWQTRVSSTYPGWQYLSVHVVPMVFVFGSNLAGIHGAGAARYAHDHHGAEWGRGRGFAGSSYALPTEDKGIRTLRLTQVRYYVDEFTSFSHVNPGITFQVTRVGCGLAGLGDEQVAPMFKDTRDNCLFDSAWERWLPGRKFWGTH